MCSSTPTRATQNQYTSSYCICSMQHAIAMVEAGCPVFILCCVLVCNEPHFFTLGVIFGPLKSEGYTYFDFLLQWNMCITTLEMLGVKTQILFS